MAVIGSRDHRRHHPRGKVRSRARNRNGVRMSGQPILCKLQENGMSQRSGPIQKPIEVG